MPPRKQITREQVVEAAFAIAREEGAEGVNARAVARRLGCSTQPVMYSFRSMEELRRAVYQRADAYQTAYLMAPRGENPMLSIGLNYVRFAVEERSLFRLLFQTNEFAGKCLPQLVEDPAIDPMLTVLAQQTGLALPQARRVMQLLFVAVHGLACMYACNDLLLDEAALAKDLDDIFYGAIAATQREDN